MVAARVTTRLVCQRRWRLFFLWRQLRQIGVDGHVHELTALIPSLKGAGERSA